MPTSSSAGCRTVMTRSLANEARWFPAARNNGSPSPRFSSQRTHPGARRGTSALDSESESAIQDALRKLVVGKTVLIIAHRFSTIRDASLIRVFDQGAIVAQGKPCLALRPNPLYRSLYDRQHGIARQRPHDRLSFSNNYEPLFRAARLAKWRPVAAMPGIRSSPPTWCRSPAGAFTTVPSSARGPVCDVLRCEAIISIISSAWRNPPTATTTGKLARSSSCRRMPSTRISPGSNTTRGLRRSGIPTT